MKDLIGRIAATLALMVLLGGTGCVKETEPPVTTVTSRPVELAATPEVTATTDRVITDFENMDGWGFSSYPVEVDGYLTQSYDDEPSHDGDSAAKLVYDFSKAGDVTAAAYAQTAHLLPLNWDSLSLWVYGDGSGHWLRAEFVDSTGEKFVGNLVSRVDWKDSWCLCTLNQSDLVGLRDEKALRHPPLALTRIYLVVLPTGEHDTGEIYFDTLTLK
ncbi:MAG: fimbrillin family protein [bacterium]|nr:fimbrillin family protein [bacterium]